ncbi:hypothetical protein SAMN02745163_04360 [Clostridium cavendishii DSM 21758]|uniref:Glycine zipper-like domain-containing protein n=1 Tax=Clostridium cavendishii DSM 21758 TaxID=1121302 RepID=A0A1M6UV87_9CLOT|nr:hypothetical protein [Clostridium cavendishii]SHK73137.1 hypothetical protein SAMN02745163_04360 [Clostridium cavendishii DSM 21758]
MSEKSNDNEYKTTNMLLCMPFGIALGLVFGNLIIGMVMGIAVGTTLDLILYYSEKKQKNN